MLHFHKLLSLLTVTLLSMVFGFSSTNFNKQSFISGTPEQKVMALNKLVEERDLSTFPLLAAINNKSLYEFDGKLVTVGGYRKIEKKNYYQIFEVYPQYQMIKEGGGAKLFLLEELNELKFSRKARLTILPVMPYINLVSVDEETRKVAYTQLQSHFEAESIPLLEKAIEKETTEEMIRFAQETYYAVALNVASSEAEQMKYIQLLVNNQGDNSSYIISHFLETHSNLSDANKTLIHEELETISSRMSRLTVIQNLFSGLSLGSILIMVSLGLAIIYGLAGVINMAHGEFMMIGAYTAFCVQETFKMLFPASELSDAFFWLSIPLSFLVSGLFGLLIERIILRKLYGRPLESLLATWGISLVFIQLARSVFGDLTSVKTPHFLSGGWEVVPQLVLPFNRIFIIVLTICMVLGLFWFLYRSRNGLRIRSVTQNRQMSACLGISTAKIDALTFFLGSGIAGIAGCCMTLIGNVVPDMGQTYIVDSFLVVVSGGVGNLLGTIAAGLGIGQLTKFFEPVFHAVYGKVLILGLVILFLQFKPRGLFPAKGRIAED